jgi:succinate dehydrogenase / fumarate reductase cytochrome b subunit
MAQAQRPLSPHLQIYRWYVTMAMSIVHRATGIAITVGLLGLTWWLVALANGPESFARVQGVFDSFLGGLVLFGFTLSLMLHAVTGVRHLLWDWGYGLNKRTATTSSYWVAGIGVGLTLLIWLAIILVEWR